MIKLTNVDAVTTQIAYKILEDNELMKLLYFNDKKALSRDDDVIEQIKYDLVYNGQSSNKTFINGKEESVKPVIYFTPVTVDAIDYACSQLRIFVSNIFPDNPRVTQLNIDFEILVHNTLWLIDGMKQRALTIAQRLLENLEEVQVKSIGNFELSSASRRFPIEIVKYNNEFSGYRVFVHTRVT